MVPYLDKSANIVLNSGEKGICVFRNAINDLKSWASKENRKPLVLRGARQVGKSTLVKLFCKEVGLELIEINLEKNKIKELENETRFSILRVLEEIEVISGKKINQNSLVFLDEIQSQPISFNRLRYFYEEKPELKIIAAGSLLEVSLDKESFSMPVGRVEQYHLGPMTFLEFLKVKNEDIVLEQILKLNKKIAPTEALNLKAIELLKEFYFIGGMPECVNEFIKTRDFKKVREIQIDLLNTYREDIPKYTQRKQGERVEEVFEYTPLHLGEKVQFTNISTAHSEKIKEAIQLLTKAHIIYPAFHNSCTGLPLKAGADLAVFKLYFLDVGLYNAKTGLEWKDFLNLNSEELITKGKMAEQFIAQHLYFREPRQISELYYWLRGGKKNAAEVDFIISNGTNIYPLEVKAGSTGKMRSLWQYVYEKKPKMALKFDLAHRGNPLSINSFSVQTNEGIKSIECPLISAPLYAIENLQNYLSD